MNNKEFDWSTVDKRWKYMATNASGTTRLYESRPKPEGHYWKQTKGRDEVYADAVPNWKDTLIKRPKEKTDIYAIKAKLTKEQSVVLDVLLEQWEAENKE